MLEEISEPLRLRPPAVNRDPPTSVLSTLSWRFSTAAPSPRLMEVRWRLSLSRPRPKLQLGPRNTGGRGGGGREDSNKARHRGDAGGADRAGGSGQRQRLDRRLTNSGLVLTKTTAHRDAIGKPLHFRQWRVRVKYSFMNTTPKDVTVNGGVSDPRCRGGWARLPGGPFPITTPANFLGFVTTVDGKAVPAQIEQKAIKERRRCDGLSGKSQGSAGRPVLRRDLRCAQPHAGGAAERPHQARPGHGGQR